MGPAGQLVKEASQSLRPQAQKKSKSIFSGGVYVGENTSQPGSVRAGRSKRTASARTGLQSPPSKESAGLF